MDLLVVGKHTEIDARLRALTEENFRWLYSLPYTHRIDGVGFYHAAPVLPSKTVRNSGPSRT